MLTAPSTVSSWTASRSMPTRTRGARPPAASSLTMVRRDAHLAPEHLRAAAALDGVLTPAVSAADLSEREVHSKETAS